MVVDGDDSEEFRQGQDTDQADFGLPNLRLRVKAIAVLSLST
jgi:hypothetical protein